MYDENAKNEAIPTRERDIFIALNALREQAERYKKLSEEFESRLEQVVRPIDTEKALTPVPELRAPLGRTLFDIAQMINEASNRLDGILAHLEI